MDLLMQVPAQSLPVSWQLALQRRLLQRQRPLGAWGCWAAQQEPPLWL